MDHDVVVHVHGATTTTLTRLLQLLRLKRWRSSLGRWSRIPQGSIVPVCGLHLARDGVRYHLRRLTRQSLIRWRLARRTAGSTVCG